MTYVISVYGDQQRRESITAEKLALRIASFDAKFIATGEPHGAYAVVSSARAKAMRVRNGAPAVAKGPSPEVKAYPASRHLVGVEGDGRHLEIAAEVPATSSRQVRVSPIAPEAAR